MKFGFPEPIEFDRHVIMITLYDHPFDFPDHIVSRAYRIGGGTGEPLPAPIGGLYTSADEAREDMPAWAFRLARNDGDDPNIIETWML